MDLFVRDDVQNFGKRRRFMITADSSDSFTSPRPSVSTFSRTVWTSPEQNRVVKMVSSIFAARSRSTETCRASSIGLFGHLQVI